MNTHGTTGASLRLISVVIPNYNSAAAVGRTIDSLHRAHSSPHTEVEIIVSDDGSSDTSAEMLGARADIKFVRQHNAGPAAARNRGAAASTGEVITFLDAGDVVGPSWLDHLVALLDDPLAGFATCGADVIDVGARTSRVLVPRAGSPRDVVALAGAFAVRRAVFDDVDGYDEELRFGENSDLVERIVRSCGEHGLGIICVPGVHVTLELGTSSRAYDRHRLDAMQHLLRRDAAALRFDVDRRVQLEAIAAVNAARCERWVEARRHAFSVARARPTSGRAWARLAVAFIPPVARRLWSGDSGRLGPSRPGDASFVASVGTVQPVSDGALYDESFFDEQRAGSRRSAESVLPVLFELIQPATMLDVGCGVGTWLAAGQRLGVEQVRGVDGASVDAVLLEIDSADFERIDLFDPSRIGTETYDLAMCLEVAEHLDKDVSQVLVDRLCAASDVVAFSAGIPGQLGTGHVNLQPQSAWAQRFATCGFEAYDFVRPRVWNDSAVEPWYRQNLVVYVNSSRSELTERAARLVAEAPPLLDIVHPDQFGYWVRRATKPISVGTGLRLTTDAARAAVRRRIPGRGDRGRVS